METDNSLSECFDLFSISNRFEVSPDPYFILDTKSILLLLTDMNPRQGFPRPDSAPTKFKNEQILTKMVYIIPNLFVLHFDAIS